MQNICGVDMVVGYVFSRKDNRELPIIRDGPEDLDVFNKKLFDLLSLYIFKEKD